LFVFWYHSPNILDTPHICDISGLRVKHRVLFVIVLEYAALDLHTLTTPQFFMLCFIVFANFKTEGHHTLLDLDE
jgi:hypothetical protein